MSNTLDGSRLNPYTNSGPWGTCTIGNLTLPGVIVSVDGATKPDEWSVQKGTASSNATTVWKGTKLAEAIKIVLNLYDRASFDAYYSVRDTLRPKIGTKPPSLLIVNAIINFSGITRVACVDVEPPKPTAGLSWLGTVTVIEYNPSIPAKTGPANPAKTAPKTPSANDEKAAALAALIAGVVHPTT